MTDQATSKVLQFAPRLVAAVTLLIGLLSLLFSVFFWAKYRAATPIDDLMRLLPLVQSFVEHGWRGVSFGEWIAPHSDAHRIAVGRLLMALDYKYLSAANTLLYLGTWSSIAVLCTAYFTVTRQSHPQYRDISIYMLGLTLIFLCSYTATYNLITPVNALWYVTAASSAASFSIVALQGRNLGIAGGIVASLFAVVAAYSTFTGVITCLVVAALALVSRTRVGIPIAVLMAVVVVTYLPDVKSGQQLVLERINQQEVEVSLMMHLQSLIGQPGRLFNYVVAFLAAPLSPSASPLPVFYFLGSLSLILFGWIALLRRMIRGQLHGTPAFRFCLAMATVCLGTALTCYLGRGFFDAPADARYQTIVMLYWLSVSGLLLQLLPTPLSASARAAAMIVLLLLPASLLLLQTEYKLLSTINRGNSNSEIEITTRLGFTSYRDPGAPLARFLDLYEQHESFLLGHTIMGAAPGAMKGRAQAPTKPCGAMRLVFRPDSPDSPRHGRVRLVVDDESWQRFRRLTIVGPDGQEGYLFPVPTSADSPRELFWDDTDWRGYYPGGRDASTHLLLFESVVGPDYHCRLDVAAR